MQPVKEDHTESTYEDDHEDDTEVIQDDHTETTYEDDKKQIKPDYGDHIEFLLE